MIVHRPHEQLEPASGEVFAVTNHKQHGDTLWSVPCARELCRRAGMRCDFWVSEYARNCLDLLQAQEFVRHVVLDHDQPVEKWGFSNAHGPGWGYAAVYDLGFRGHFDVPIPEYYSRLCGLPQLPNRFDLPPGYEGRPLPEEPFVALASKGKGTTDYWRLFHNFAEHCPYPVVEVGYPGESLRTWLPNVWDHTSEGFLEMAWVISKCRWFVGLMSSPLVVASGWDCVKVAPHSGIHWTMSHVIRTPLHHYPCVGWPVSDDPAPLLELIR